MTMLVIVTNIVAGFKQLFSLWNDLDLVFILFLYDECKYSISL